MLAVGVSKKYQYIQASEKSIIILFDLVMTIDIVQ